MCRFFRCAGAGVLLWSAATLDVLLYAAPAVSPPAQAGVSAERGARVTFDAEQRRLHLHLPAQARGEYEWQIVTPGLTSAVETGAEVKEPGIIYLPPPEDARGQAALRVPAEMIFFFHDLETAPEWEVAVEFPSGVRGTWKLNGRFSPLGGTVALPFGIPVEALEPGENLLHFQGTVERPALAYRRRVTGEADASLALTVARADWRGQVRLLRHEPNASTVVLLEQNVGGADYTRHERDIPERWWEDRALLTQAALGVGKNLLQSQITRSDSLFAGGFNLVYDLQVQSHRIQHWMWAWGPSVHLLLELEKLDAAKQAGLADRFRATAVAAAERTLQFEMTEPRHPAQGVSTVRWEPSRATPSGWAEYISTADSLFMAGWGWMSMYEATGEPVYLERMKSLVAAAERLMDAYPVVPQDWIIERQRWTPHTLDESVFGTIGFRRLYEATQDQAVARAGRRFLDSHREHMGREGGLLMRGWMREEDEEIWDPDIKGHAWVIEGYLDAYRLSQDEKYLRLADELAERVMACQSPDGSWTYLFKQAGPDDPADDKGTSIWAYLFYDLYRSSRNPEHLAAGRKALGWCLHQQYRGEDPYLDGAVVHPNGMAYIQRRPMTILYTTTFFGLALLEELALSDGK